MKKVKRVQYSRYIAKIETREQVMRDDFIAHRKDFSVKKVSQRALKSVAERIEEKYPGHSAEIIEIDQYLSEFDNEFTPYGWIIRCIIGILSKD